MKAGEHARESLERNEAGITIPPHSHFAWQLRHRRTSAGLSKKYVLGPTVMNFGSDTC